MQKTFPVWFIYGVLGFFLMLGGILAMLVFRPAPEFLVVKAAAILPAQSAKYQRRWLQLDLSTCRFILRCGLPVLERNAGEDDPYLPVNLNWQELYWNMAVNIKSASPEEMLRAQIPLLAMYKPKPVPVKIAPAPEALPQANPLPELTTPELKPAPPQVLIYHTHTSESYLAVSGKDHVYPQGDVVKVGDYLEQLLEARYGIECVHDETSHDSPYLGSYGRAQKTVIQKLEEYPTTKVVLDLHRDATPGVEARFGLKGESCATIGMVVGSDKMGLLHPGWKKNHEFAITLGEAMDRYYPGLKSRIVISPNRFNQHLLDHALIIEVGDHRSTLPEAYRATELFAEILSIVIAGKETERI